MGLSETLSSEAFARTAFSDRPKCSPITRVGVFWLASRLNWLTSLRVHAFPEFRVYFAIGIPHQAHLGRENAKAPLDAGSRNRLTAHATEEAISFLDVSASTLAGLRGCQRRGSPRRWYFARRIIHRIKYRSRGLGSFRCAFPSVCPVQRN